jgi:hypothetical protein
VEALPERGAGKIKRRHAPKIHPGIQVLPFYLNMKYLDYLSK